MSYGVKNKTTAKTLPLRSCNKSTVTTRMLLHKLLDCVKKEMLHSQTEHKSRSGDNDLQWLNRNHSFSGVEANIIKSYCMIGADVYFVNRDYEGPKLQKKRFVHIIMTCS